MTSPSDLTGEQISFLLSLVRWGGSASARDLGPQMSQADNSARQTCKRHGWVIYEGGYWCLTYAGREMMARRRAAIWRAKVEAALKEEG